MNKIPTFAYNISLKVNEGVIKSILCTIKTGSPLDEIAANNSKSLAEMAVIILKASKILVMSPFDYGHVTPDDVDNVSPCHEVSASMFTVKIHNSIWGCDYYIPPEGESEIMLCRDDPDTGEHLTNQFIVPTNVLNMDCECRAIKLLFLQIMQEYKAENSITDPQNWHDFIQIPNKFLKKYGVQQKEDNVIASMTVAANEEMM